MKYRLEVEIEIKEEHGGANNVPPSPFEVAAYVHDSLRDAVRGEYDINWMPRGCKPLEEHDFAGRDIAD